MAGDPFQAWVGSTQKIQQVDQAGDLFCRVRLGHVLGAEVEPVGIAPQVDELNAQTSLIESTHVMGDAFRWNPLFNPAVTVYVVVSRMAGAGLRVVNSHPELPGGGQVGEFRAVNDHQVDAGRLARIELLCIG